MSDHNLCFVPVDPRFVPDQPSQDAAVALLRAAWPDARDVEADSSVRVVFRDCGENFERVLCPHCSTEIDVGPWQQLIDSDYSEADGFRLNAMPMRCCGQPSTVNDLVYEWPQGFSRFALTVAD